jgi:hypothetical protein
MTTQCFRGRQQDLNVADGDFSAKWQRLAGLKMFARPLMRGLRLCCEWLQRQSL